MPEMFERFVDPMELFLVMFGGKRVGIDGDEAPREREDLEREMWRNPFEVWHFVHPVFLSVFLCRRRAPHPTPAHARACARTATRHNCSFAS